MTSQGPLHIMIAGGGIGGLVAAIALRQAGHHVEVFEQSSLSHETGAAVHLVPNCNGLLRRLGLRAESLGAVECLANDNYTADGVLEEKVVYPDAESTWGYPWHLVHRQALHTALRELAISENGKGKPVQLHLSSRVKSADPEAARLIFEDGLEVQGDLIIGADGVHSTTRKAIPGGDLTPFDSGKSAYRFLIPTSALAADPLTAKYVAEPGHQVMWTRKPKKIVMYPCNEGKAMNFVAMHPSHESAHDGGGEGGAWQETGDKERLLKIYSEFAPSVQAVLEKVDAEKLKVWNLLDLETMPSFVEGRLAILGDAAHPFLPHQGQGAGQAVEDGVSLATVLPLGTTASEIPERLRLYERCRYERAHKIQDNTRLTGEGGSASSADKTNFANFISYNFMHDESQHSTNELRRFLEAKEVQMKTGTSGNPMFEQTDVRANRALVTEA